MPCRNVNNNMDTNWQLRSRCCCRKRKALLQRQRFLLLSFRASSFNHWAFRLNRYSLYHFPVLECCRNWNRQNAPLSAPKSPLRPHNHVVQGKHATPTLSTPINGARRSKLPPSHYHHLPTPSLRPPILRILPADLSCARFFSTPLTDKPTSAAKLSRVISANSPSNCKILPTLFPTLFFTASPRNTNGVCPSGNP